MKGSRATRRHDIGVKAARRRNRRLRDRTYIDAGISCEAGDVCLSDAFCAPGRRAPMYQYRLAAAAPSAIMMLAGNVMIISPGVGRHEGLWCLYEWAKIHHRQASRKCGNMKYQFMGATISFVHGARTLDNASLYLTGLAWHGC